MSLIEIFYKQMLYNCDIINLIGPYWGRIYRNDPERNRILQYSDDSGRYPDYHKVMESDENGRKQKEKEFNSK